MFKSWITTSSVCWILLSLSKGHASRILPSSTWQDIHPAPTRHLTQVCPSTGGTRIVRSGDTLSDIATTCGTTTQCLQTANSISNADQINVGQVLQVPSSCATSTSPSPAASAPSPSSGCPAATGSYTVKTGDQLSAIATTCGTTTACLQSANPVITNPDLIQLGQTIRVPASCANSPSSAPPAASPGSSSDCGAAYTKDYSLQTGDTIFNIASTCGVRQDCLVTSNPSIAANPASVIAGQHIKIPASCGLSSSTAVPQASKSSGSNTGAIAGGVVGGVVGAALVLAIVAFFLLRRRRSQQSTRPIDRKLTNPWDQPLNSKPSGRRNLRDWIVGRPSREAVYTGATTTTATTDSLGVPIQMGSSGKMAPLHSREFNPEDADNPTVMSFDDMDLGVGPAERGSAPLTNVEHTKMMIDQDLPGELQEFWRYDRKQLKVHLDGQGKPVTLGRGAFGTVYKGTLGLRTVAIKVVHSTSEEEQARFVQEIARLRVLRDPNIVMFLGASLQASRTVLVMEYLPGGNLWDALGKDVIEHEGDRQLQWYRGGHQIALDIARGLFYLHDKGIVHLDLKTPNILLDEHNNARIADIGLSKVLAGQDVQASPGTTLWASPEQIQRKLCSQSSDIYSFGVILWEICSGLPLKNRVLGPLRVPEDCPKAVADLVNLCCQQSPAARPAIDAIFNVLKAAPKSLYA
ncbi:hypothetical protein WJX74_003018 [Apatococcus lobatus]|uniref:Uncharacterized protein n=1 Tax=Apatococcus lobatus TaxID=904363 RepID=A0AAW1RSJ0_9CHLO